MKDRLKDLKQLLRKQSDCIIITLFCAGPCVCVNVVRAATQAEDRAQAGGQGSREGSRAWTSRGTRAPCQLDSFSLSLSLSLSLSITLPSVVLSPLDNICPTDTLVRYTGDLPIRPGCDL